MKSNHKGHSDVDKLYYQLEIVDRQTRKEIRNTINTGNMFNKRKVGIATASSARVNNSQI